MGTEVTFKVDVICDRCKKSITSGNVFDMGDEGFIFHLQCAHNMTLVDYQGMRGEDRKRTKTIEEHTEQQIRWRLR